MSFSKIVVHSPLGDEAFQLKSMAGAEMLGRSFAYELDLLSTLHDIHPTDLLGQTLTIALDIGGDATRYFHGYVTRLAVGVGQGRYSEYRATVQSWLWFLTRTTNCRIFQGQSVPEVVKHVFRAHGFTDFEDALGEAHRSFDYLVQYRETDLDFVTRLMEQEGIYYYFRHEQGKHILVMADGYGAHQTASGYETIPFYPPNDNLRRERDHLDMWRFRQQVKAGEYVLDSYDFKRPRAELQVSLRAPLSHERDDFQVYDYPGEYIEVVDGEQYARVRLEEQQADAYVANAEGNVRGLFPGALFALTGYPRDDQNQEYLVTSTSFTLRGQSLESARDVSEEAVFRCKMSVILGSTQFRPSRSVPRPVMPGPQTARVVGKAGEEIWTDEFGRIKVLFHWDREGKGDEKSSCWLRVAQVWAGNGWGTIHIPRIGQEVVVSFLEGDPDRPLVTGSVYNGNMAPPFPLPGAAMVSGVKSDSTPGGGGYNEISLDDTKGKEKIVVHAQRDMGSTVEHNQATMVRNDRTTSVNRNHSETIGGSQTISIGGGQSMSIGKSASVSVGASSTETVTVAKALTIGAAYQVSVGGALNETVVGLKAEEIGGLRSVNVGAASTENVVGNKTLSAKNISESAAANVTIKSGKSMSLESGESFGINGKKKGMIELADELTIKVGSASITMKKNGDITIKGKKISIEGSGDVVIKGSKIKQN